MNFKLAGSSLHIGASLIAQLVKNLPVMQETPGLKPGSGRSPGEGIGYPFWYSQVSLVAQLVKNPSAMQEAWVQSLGREDPHSMDCIAHGVTKRSFSFLCIQHGSEKNSIHNHDDRRHEIVKWLLNCQENTCKVLMSGGCDCITII